MNAEPEAPGCSEWRIGLQTVSLESSVVIRVLRGHTAHVHTLVAGAGIAGLAQPSP